MTFEHVLTVLKGGGKARRASWNSAVVVVICVGEFWRHHPGAGSAPWGPTGDDLLADDWVVVMENPADVARETKRLMQGSRR